MQLSGNIVISYYILIQYTYKINQGYAFLINKVGLFINSKESKDLVEDIVNKLVFKYKTADLLVRQYKTEFQVTIFNQILKNNSN